MLFHVAEAAFEFRRRTAKRGFRIDATMPRVVDDGEQQITNLVLHIRGARRRFGLVQFLNDLGFRAACVGPVKADAGRALLDLLSSQQRR